MVIDGKGQIPGIILKQGNVVFKVECVSSKLIFLLGPYHIIINMLIILSVIYLSFIPFLRLRAS